MANPAKTLPFSKFTIELGDGATPENFSRPCGITARSFSRKANTNDTVVPDCDDEDAPAWTESDIVSYSLDLSGSGVIDNEDQDSWEDWLSDGGIRNVRVTLDTRRYVFAAVLAEFTMTGSRGNKVTYNVSIKGSGAPTFTP